MVQRPTLHLLGLVVAVAAITPTLWVLARGAAADAALWSSVLRSASLRTATLHTLGLGLLVGVLCGAIVLPLAWVTHATNVGGRGWLQRALLLPLAVPSYVSGFVVMAVVGPSGWLRAALPWLPEAQGWFGTTVALLFAYPYALLPVQAALAQLDPRVWEAARSLGATPAQAFWRGVFPAIAPAWVGGMLLTGLYAVSDFGAVSLMRFPSLSYVVYARYTNPFMRDEATVYAAILAALALAVVITLQATQRRGASGRLGKPWPPHALAAGSRLAATGAAWAVVAAFAVLPAAVVAGWFVRGYAAGNTLVDLRGELVWTVTLGVAAASLATAAALVPAWLGRVGAWWAVRGVDAAVVSMTALPGVVVGLAFVVMGARVLPALHHTVHLLLLAYVLRFLGQAATSLSTGFGPHTTRLHEAARSLGHGPVVGWLRGVLPAARPAFVAAWLAVFLSVIKELPATLLLRPPGTSTLAVRVWSLTQDAFFTAASPTVLLLMLLAFAALTLSPIQSGARRSGGVHG